MGHQMLPGKRRVLRRGNRLVSSIVSGDSEESLRTCAIFRTIPGTVRVGNDAGWISSYDQSMARTDLYVKVELDHDDEENVERLASEICRLVRRVYGVRNVEISSIIEKDK